MVWSDIAPSFSNVAEGTYREILLSAVREAYEGNPSIPPRSVWRFAYSKCMDKMISAGY